MLQQNAQTNNTWPTVTRDTKQHADHTCATYNIYLVHDSAIAKGDNNAAEVTDNGNISRAGIESPGSSDCADLRVVHARDGLNLDPAKFEAINACAAAQKVHAVDHNPRATLPEPGRDPNNSSWQQV